MGDLLSKELEYWKHYSMVLSQFKHLYGCHSLPCLIMRMEHSMLLKLLLVVLRLILLYSAQKDTHTGVNRLTFLTVITVSTSVSFSPKQRANKLQQIKYISLAEFFISVTESI